MNKKEKDERLVNDLFTIVGDPLNPLANHFDDFVGVTSVRTEERPCVTYITYEKKYKKYKKKYIFSVGNII